MYVIRQTRHYYGPTETKSLIDSQDTGKPMQFMSRKAALEYIAQLETEPYYMGHNEASHPDYKVLRADNLPQYLRR